MSISPPNNLIQTGLVPNSLLGYSSNADSAIEILPSSITLGGNLTTTPVYVSINATTGLSTTNPNGIQISSDIDMNNNDITEVNNITATTLTGSASTVALTSDNTDAVYVIPFSKTTLSTANALYYDNTPNGLSYNPFTSTIDCQNISSTIQLPTATINIPTAFSGTTLTVDFGNTSFINYRTAITTGSTNTINTLVFTGGITNGTYQIQIHNGGTGVLTIASSFSPNTTYVSSNASNTNAAANTFAIMTVKLLNFTVGAGVSSRYVITSQRLV